MGFKITFCVSWTFLAISMKSLLINGIPDPFTDLPMGKKCIDSSKVCSLGLKCNTGMMVELPIQSLMGPPGPAGQPGPAGERGIEGEIGQEGLPGFVGPIGETGSTGVPGELGPAGERGEQGEKGEKGVLGERGPQSSYPGLKGVLGETGRPGPVGEMGPTGEYGYPGERGNPGERGPAGRPGERGFNGRPGMYGLPGTVGPKGFPGKPGKSNECRVAFHVGVQTPKNYSGINVNTPLSFDKVLVNIDNNFIPSEGKFIAPLRGTFSFYVSVAAQDGKQAAVTVEKNGEQIGNVYANSRATWGAASSAFVMKLEGREEVSFLVIKTAPNILGSMYTSVSGFCVSRDE